MNREQIEKVWRSKWLFEQAEWSKERYGTIRCSSCKRAFSGDSYLNFLNIKKFKHFCPRCGAAMTDDAVDIVMKRLEALYGDR